MPLYKLTSPSGKAYIGITRGEMRVRLNHHRFDAENNCGHLLHKAIKKYGFDNFKVEVLHNSINPDELCKLEIAAISDHNTFRPAGYNLTRGGEGVVGTSLSHAHIQVLTAARRKRKSEKTKEELAIEKARRVAGGKIAADKVKGDSNYNHAECIAVAKAMRTPEQIAAEKANRSAAAKARWEKPGHREKVAATYAETRKGDSFKATRSAASKLAWCDEARARRANRTPEQVAAEKANRSAAAKARWAAGNFRKSNANPS